MSEYDDPDNSYIRAEHDTIRKTLVGASLVARAWIEPSQTQLWRLLDRRGGEELERVLASPLCGKLRTVGVALYAFSESDGEAVGRVLGKLKGLYSANVSLQDGNGGELEMSAEWLNLPSLAGKSSSPLSSNGEA